MAMLRRSVSQVTDKKLKNIINKEEILTNKSIYLPYFIIL